MLEGYGGKRVQVDITIGYTPGRYVAYEFRSGGFVLIEGDEGAECSTVVLAGFPQTGFTYRTIKREFEKSGARPLKA